MADGSRLFDASRDRDPSSLADVYRTHAGYVWRVLRHCGVPDPDLDDAVQETFLVVARRLPELERASLRTWIYAVATRVASTRRRSQRREDARRAHAGLGVHGTGAVDPEAALSKTEAAALVDGLLDELDAQKRIVFVLAELEGVKVPEISRILGVNPRTVHSRLRLARESFGAALRRLQAREANDRRVERLRPRPLLRRATHHRPPAPRREAALAALLVRVEQGAMPALVGWETLALTSAGPWALPVAVLGALGAAAVAAVVTLGGPEGRSAHGVVDGPRAAVEPTASLAVADDEPPSDGSTTIAPSIATTSTIDAPVVPNSQRRAPHATTLRPAASTGAAIATTLQPIASDGATTTTTNEAIIAPAATNASSPRASTTATPPAAHEDGHEVASTTPLGRSEPSTSLLETETRLLERARRALRANDPEAALSTLDAYDAEVSGGVLLDEARSTRLRALCAAGRPDEAAALAGRLAQGRAGSRWYDVVAAACG